MDNILFFILSALAIGGALMVILARNPVYSVLFTILTFFAIGGHFLLLNAQFLFIVNIIVYAGAIMVLFLYVIMMLNLNKQSEPTQPFFIKVIAAISGGLLLITLLGALRGMDSDKVISDIPYSDIGLVKNLGKVLFTEYLIPFEISSVLFLSAMIGAVMLGKKNLKDH
ncbi:MAG: NADH-quinone oxidoreductase subunit J [Cytophagaceae bacterium]|nr:NADH-quinone oxidoreductase subunit J [Cytophagaceae bacterium]